MVKDLMMWVGEKYYPTIDEFITEARVKGVSKRIGTVPNSVSDKSRCFLLHRDGTQTPRCFGYFHIYAVTCMITGADLQELLKKYSGSVRYTLRSQFPAGERDCGEMQPGGLYMVSEDVFDKVKCNASEFTLESGLVVFKQPYPHMSRCLKNFRGYQYVDGDALIETFQEWYRKQSQKKGV